MRNSKVFQLMCERGLADWKSLATGWKRHWVTKSYLVSWAVRWLEEHPDEGRTPVLLLAGGESLDDEAVSSLLAEIEPENETCLASSLEKWRLAMLMDLAASELSWDEKVSRLESLRTEFGYPDDMRECTRYGSTPVDALDAMHAVIDQLKARWHVH